jgi:hypothetical protein
MTTVTQWFDGGKEHPFRSGVYQVKASHLPANWRDLFAYWDGKRFSWLSETTKEAFRCRARLTPANVSAWRGLAEKPQP